MAKCTGEQSASVKPACVALAMGSGPQPPNPHSSLHSCLQPAHKQTHLASDVFKSPGCSCCAAKSLSMVAASVYSLLPVDIGTGRGGGGDLAHGVFYQGEIGLGRIWPPWRFPALLAVDEKCLGLLGLQGPHCGRAEILVQQLSDAQPGRQLLTSSGVLRCLRCQHPNSGWGCVQCLQGFPKIAPRLSCNLQPSIPKGKGVGAGQGGIQPWGQ